MAAAGHRCWRLLRRGLHCSAAARRLGDPEPDWAYLLDPANTAAIRANCRSRGSAGDIDRVLELHRAAAERPSEALRRQLLEEALRLPNRTHPHSPVGDEAQARLLDEHFPPTPDYAVAPGAARSAVDIGRQLALLRTSHVSLSTGPRTYYFAGGLALLERALVQLALDRLVGRNGAGFEQVSVPDVIPAELVERCGFPTRGARTQVYHLGAEGGLCLAGTAEMSLAGLVAGHQFPSAALPRRLCAVSRCFRREAPQQEEPLYRVHQFTKVEMFGVAAAGGGGPLMDQLVALQTALLRDLGLRFRVLEMPTEELGAPAYRKVDVEAWMAASGAYGEVSSASNCTDFQARRLLVRDGSGAFADTVNATAVAVPRVVKAILETHQDEKGLVRLPEVLWPWMGGTRVLRRQHPPLKFSFIERLKYRGAAAARETAAAREAAP